MKKKILSICICMLMIGLPVPFILSDNGNSTSVFAIDNKKVEDCGCGSQQLNSHQQSIIEVLPVNDSVNELMKPSANNNLPSSFSWTDVNGTDWTTSAKDQGSCGRQRRLE